MKFGSIKTSFSLLFGCMLASCLPGSTVEFPKHVDAQLTLTEHASGRLGVAPLAVVAAGPHGEVEPSLTPGVTLVFNRAMRRLGSEVPEPVPALQLLTGDGQAVAGDFRWVGTHGLLFEPKTPLAGATQFRVTVPANTRSLDGSLLANAYVLEFTTARPELVASEPSEHFQLAKPDAPIFLRFSQPIETASLERHAHLSYVVSSQSKPTNISFTARREAPEHRKAYGQEHWVAVHPSQPLPANSNIELLIAPGLTSLSGPLSTKTAMRWSVHTYGPLQLENVVCAQQASGRCQAHRDITAVMSTPVPPAEFRRHLKLDGPERTARPTTGAPAPSNKPSTSHALALDPNYGDRFNITLRAGMQDIFGQRLAKDVKVSVAVEDPYTTPSQASGLTGAQRPGPAEYDVDDQSPRRPALQYALEFGVRGHVLEALDGPGGTAGPAPHRVQIGSVNIPSFGVRSRAYPEPVAVRWLGQRRGGRGEDTVSPSWSWFTPNTKPNERAVREFDIDQALSTENSRGSLLVEMMALGSEDPQSTFLSVTDLGLSAHISRLGSLIWVTQLASGKPAANAQVSIYDKDGIELATHSTDALGLASFAPDELKPITRQEVLDSSLVLVARAGKDWTFQRIEPLGVDPGVTRDPLQTSQWAGMVFSDRGVYRPGETLRGGGYFRKTSDRELIVPKQQAVDFIVTDALGETIAQGASKLDNFGALALDVALPGSASLGQATLTVRLGRRYDERFSTSFQLLNYKPAEFKVGVAAEHRELVHGASAEFQVTAEYLYGAPVANARVEQFVTRTEVQFTPPNTDGYVLSDAAFRDDLRFIPHTTGAFEQQTGALDAQGRITRRVNVDGPSPGVPIRLGFEAEIRDQSEQTQSARGSVLVHPAAYYVGVQRPAQRFLAVGATLNPTATAFDPSGKPLVGIPLKLELWHRTWTTAIEDRAADSLYYNTRVRDEPAGRCETSSGAKRTDCNFRLSIPGYYILRASTQDRLGNPASSSVSVYAVNDRDDSSTDAVGWREPDRRGLALETDRETYQPGQVAKILVKNPFREGTALVTIERAGILSHQVTRLVGPMPVLEIPIREEYFPNAYVSVHLLRGRVTNIPQLINSGLADVGAPQFRVGYATLAVSPESRRIKVDVKAENPSYLPGTEVNASVQLRAANGQPTSGSVTFYVVDEGVLSLTGYQTPDPLPAFSAHRSLGVFPVESREHLARLIYLKPGERFSPLGWETQAQAGSSDKGDEVGDGGDGGVLRSNFRTTIFFEAGRAVGADGRAAFRFKLPDNLTSFRLMAVAAGDGDRFGSGQDQVVVNQPLMLRPQLPRVLRVGDSLQVGVAVASLGLPTSSVAVSLTAADAAGRKTEQATQVQVARGGQTALRFGVEATKAGDMTFEFAARAASASDRVRLTRKVEQPTRWLRAAAYGATKDSATLGLPDLRQARPELGGLQVNLSSSALVGLKDVFTALEEYPYGCTEQLASRVLPRLAAAELAHSAGVAMANGPVDWIDAALGQLVERQRYDGSFGYWQGDDSQVTWLSAYALFALERGTQAGYFVPKAARSRGADGLSYQLERLLSEAERAASGELETDSEFARGDSNAEPKHRSAAEAQRLRLAEAVFVADVLAGMGQLRQPQVRQLATFVRGLPLSAKAQLVHAMARTHIPVAEIQPLLTEVLAGTRIGSWEARVESADPALSELFESPVRTTAWVLQAVLAVDPQHPAVEKLARGLVGFRARSAYRTTQENAWALLALEDYRRSREPQPQELIASLTLGSAPSQTRVFHTSAEQHSLDFPTGTLLDVHPASISLKVNSGGPLYYAAQMTVAADGASGLDLDEGLSIEKRMRGVDPSQLQATRGLSRDQSLQANLGQLVLVDLLLESVEARDQVVVEDPLPAGLEPVDLGFETTTQALSQSIESAQVELEALGGTWARPSQPQLVHREIHDDKILLFLPKIEPGIHHLRYIARATTPGRFVMPPTRATCMYEPEVFGQTKSSFYSVNPVLK